MPPLNPLKVDLHRIELPFTGFLVRAILPRDPKNQTAKNREKFTRTDINRLTAESLFRWMRAKGGQNLRAETVVMKYLGHDIDKDTLAKWDKSPPFDKDYNCPRGFRGKE